jgi:hypothetical protein
MNRDGGGANERPLPSFQFGGRLALDLTWTARYRRPPHRAPRRAPRPRTVARIRTTPLPAPHHVIRRRHDARPPRGDPRCCERRDRRGTDPEFGSSCAQSMCPTTHRDPDVEQDRRDGRRGTVGRRDRGRRECDRERCDRGARSGRRTSAQVPWTALQSAVPRRFTPRRSALVQHPTLREQGQHQGLPRPYPERPVMEAMIPIRPSPPRHAR